MTSTLTHRVVTIALDRLLVLEPELIGHTCLHANLEWRHGEAHVTIDWCGGQLRYQPTEQLVSSVRRLQ